MGKRKFPETQVPETAIVERDAHGRLLPGSKLGTGHSRTAARVRNLIAHIAETTNDGRIIATQLLQIAQNEGARDADRIRAMEVLLDRMIGKAVDIQATVDLTQAQGGLAGNFAGAVLETLIRQLPAPRPAEVIDVTPASQATDVYSVAQSTNPLQSPPDTNFPDAPVPPVSREDSGT